MISRRMLMTHSAAVAAGLALPAFAADQKRPAVSATLEIDQTQVAFLFSGSFGGGVLHYRGKSYEFNVGGLGIGGIGANTMKARGDVYGLKKLSDFNGVYGNARVGWAFGDQGSGHLWLQNPANVVLSLSTERQGLALTAGADGVVISLKS